MFFLDSLKPSAKNDFKYSDKFYDFLKDQDFEKLEVFIKNFDVFSEKGYVTLDDVHFGYMHKNNIFESVSFLDIEQDNIEFKNHNIYKIEFMQDLHTMKNIEINFKESFFHLYKEKSYCMFDNVNHNLLIEKDDTKYTVRFVTLKCKYCGERFYFVEYDGVKIETNENFVTFFETKDDKSIVKILREEHGSISFNRKNKSTVSVAIEGKTYEIYDTDIKDSIRTLYSTNLTIDNKFRIDKQKLITIKNYYQSVVDIRYKIMDEFHNQDRDMYLFLIDTFTTNQKIDDMKKLIELIDLELERRDDRDTTDFKTTTNDEVNENFKSYYNTFEKEEVVKGEPVPDWFGNGYYLSDILLSNMIKGISK